jgi:plasmid stabilization system protein ParE
MNDRRTQLGGLLVVVACALVPLGGCGEGGSPAAKGEIPAPARPAEAQGASDSPAPYLAKTEDEKRIRQTAAALRDAFDRPVANADVALRRAGSACAVMSARMRSHVVAAARASGSPVRSSSCRHAAMHLIALRRHAPPSRIVGIAVAGDTAVAKLRESGGKASEMRLVKKGGRWKVAAPTQATVR